MGTVKITDGTSNTMMGFTLTNTMVSGIVSPRDAASGLATGRRQHLPLTLSLSL